MKIELEIDAEKLEKLDSDLTDMLASLSAQQKTEIIKSYLLNQFDKWEVTTSNSWGVKSTEMSNFAKEVVSGLKEAIKKAIFEDVIKDEAFLEKMNKEIEEIRKGLPFTIQYAIATYVAEQVFMNSNSVKDMMYQQMSSHYNNYHNPHY